MKRVLAVLLALGALCYMGSAIPLGTTNATDAVIANGHLLGVEGTAASFCTCGKDCTCTIAEDGTHCTCGKEILKVNIAGKYYCRKCNGSIAGEPGTCPACKEPLTKTK